MNRADVFQFILLSLGIGAIFGIWLRGRMR